MAMASTFLGNLSQLEEEEKLYESMNAELDKQIEQDMQDLNNILFQHNTMPQPRKRVPRPPLPKIVKPPPPKIVKPLPPKIVKPLPPKIVKPQPPKTNIIERLGLQITDDDVDMYQSMNSELDKQIAKDMEQIKNYISKTDGKIDLAKRIEFFNTMDTTPITNNQNHVTDHILYQHTPLGNIKWHECIQCNFKSTEMSILENHIVEKHTSVENTDWFRCPRCPFMSKRNGDVQEHLKLGHNDRAEEPAVLKCKECDVRLLSNEDVVRHLLEAHGKEAEFKCKQCSFMTDDQSSLKQHMLAEHIKLNISWYKCAQCAYRTVRKATLDRHIMCKHQSGNFLF